MNQQRFYNLSSISQSCSRIRSDYKYATTSQDQSCPKTYPNHLGLGHDQRPYDGRLALTESKWSPPSIIDNLEKPLPPGYYRALDDDGEYHLYPVEDENWERQRQINEQFGLILQALALCMSALSKIGIAIPTVTSQNLSKSGENMDSGIEEKAICHAKILHTTEETRDKLREWEHVISEEKTAKSPIDQ